MLKSYLRLFNPVKAHSGHSHTRIRLFMSFSSPATVRPTTLGTSQIDERILLESSDAKWIKLQLLKWTDEDGKSRMWEMAARKTTAKSGVDAAAIAAILKAPGKPLSIPIILQYRPPVGAVCAELPAGLIDESESASETAVRELHEETGYGGDAFEGRVKVIEVGGVVPSDPGMSSANMHLVTLEVELKEGEQEPKPKLEPGEHIEVRITELASLYSHLQGYEKLGYSVDARLHHFAAGIEIAKKYKLT